MTVQRVMGIETEYGVLQPGNPMANPMLMSSHVVAVHASAREGARTRARWDYDDEDPLHDARGFRLERASAHPSLLTDDPSRAAPAGPSGDGLQDLPRSVVEEYDDPGAANVILTNGARLYVDHAHPEYSSPEVLSPREAVRYDRAGEQVMLASVRALAANPALPDVTLYKNNVDGKGATYGMHENYLVERAVPFASLAARLIPFLATRQVYTGAGRVGLGQHGERAGYQLSQRADYVEAEIGLETTLRRPIVNTRDEPHADPDRWRRLHVIVGDATMLEAATYVRLGTTSLVLWLLEQDTAGEHGPLAEALDALALRDPVTAVHTVSHDLTLTARLPLVDGRSLTALEVQRAYLDAVRAGLAAVTGSPDGADDETADVLRRWASLLDRLGTDPASCAREVEWLAKLRLLEGMRRRDHLGWDHPRLAAVDLQWSDLRPERGLYHRLVGAGAVELLLAPDDVSAAVRRPPEATRAYFRGEAVARYGGHISAASWDSIVFDVPGAATLQRVPMRDPLRGTRAHVGDLLDASPDARTLLEALGR
ncbi:depupylase/deamidase Dop [Cellulomonas marina]|uniref:Proteasome accessory factor A n=1 Tax=Cellulomonas marina TaxID=988821 RepID=A0A1I0ZTR3_9CELL|nr:depupylase/deamidase Dop [Cellulomonas marina]GIG28855.1 proteasome accessory factor PafA2 [Cellulomonas marina]SFB27583.1 proteasome accessory factor A [Cellulomonas marina]